MDTLQVFQEQEKLRNVFQNNVPRLRGEKTVWVHYWIQRLIREHYLLELCGISEAITRVGCLIQRWNDNLRGFLIAYVKEHPEIDINIIIPNEENIKKVLESLNLLRWS